VLRKVYAEGTEAEVAAHAERTCVDPAAP